MIDLDLKCDWCEETGIGCNDNGEWLCEDCMFDWACEEYGSPYLDDYD